MNRKLEKKVTETAREFGALVSVEQGKKHDRITVSYGGRTRFVICSHTPSDCFAEKKILADVRREIRNLAA